MLAAGWRKGEAHLGNKVKGILSLSQILHWEKTKIDTTDSISSCRENFFLREYVWNKLTFDPLGWSLAGVFSGPTEADGHDGVQASV